MTITYDGTDILNNIQKTRLVQHESVADFNINSLKPSRADGTLFINEVIDTKQIIIEGIIQGTTQANLEANIDTFNELMSRKNKNLDISYAGGTRRYVCIPGKVNYVRDYYNLLFVPFSIIMQVPLGVGKDTSTTTLTAKTLTAVTTTDTLTFSGSAEPKPVIKVTINTRGNGDVVRIENTDNDDYIDVDLDDFVATDYLEVDCENLTVLKNGTTELNYRGMFPRFEIGANNIKYTVFGSGYTIDQQNQAQNACGDIFNNGGNIPSFGQSFIPSQSGIIGKISMFVGKTGSPGGTVYLRLYDDNNNKVGTSFVSSEDLTVSTFTTALFAFEFLTMSMFVEAGKRYWITLNAVSLTGSDSLNKIYFLYQNDATHYLNGKAIGAQTIASITSGVDGVAEADEVDNVLEGQFDYYFIVYLGDGDAPDFNLSAQATYTKKYL